MGKQTVLMTAVGSYLPANVVHLHLVRHRKLTLEVYGLDLTDSMHYLQGALLVGSSLQQLTLFLQYSL